MLPLVKELLQLLDRHKTAFSNMAVEAGYSSSIIYGWRSGGKSPGLAAFIDIASSIGFEVVLQPKAEHATQSAKLAVLDYERMVKETDRRAWVLERLHQEFPMLSRSEVEKLYDSL